MEFNPDKCKVLRITNKRKIVISNYIMHNQILEVVESAKYLGVFINKKLSWNKHIDYTAKKANQVRCFTQRNLRTCHRDIKLQSYKTYVRPILEYGSIVWDPHTSNNIHKLEMVQRKAARSICSDWRYTSSPTTMLENLNLQTLQQRRMENKVKYMHKILHGQLNTLSHLVTRARTSNVRLVPINARILSYQHSYIPSTVNLWNNLPTQIANELDYGKFCLGIYNYDM